MNYAQRIRDLREDGDYTQKEIADILKTTQSYYAQYENGHRPLPIDHLITLCKFYNVSADYILGLKDEM
ncbi:MAG: helix-turn-helix transcriptional regulator [Ruminococcaceae bacterium]|nr:helix-turn-helix transcriptional regulator [Oscillospiraceae bacterium]